VEAKSKVVNRLNNHWGSPNTKPNLQRPGGVMVFVVVVVVVAFVDASI
jgi:hypothetical protein